MESFTTATSEPGEPRIGAAILLLEYMLDKLILHYSTTQMAHRPSYHLRQTFLRSR